MKKSGIIKDYIYVLKIIKTASPLRISLTVAMGIIGNGFGLFYGVFFMAYLMGCIETGRDFRHVFAMLLGGAILNIVFEIGNSYYNSIYAPISDLKISIYIKKMLCEKIRTVDIACFDSPAYYDDAALVLQDATGRIMGALNTISAFITHAFCVGALIAFFTQVDLLIVFIALVPLVLSLIFVPITNKMKYKYNIAVVPEERKFEYVKRTIIQSEYAKELRITNIKNVLVRLLRSGAENTKALLKKHYKKITGVETITVFLGFGIVCFAATLISIYRILVTQSMGVAMFIPLWGALAGFGWRAGSVVETYSKLSNDRLYIDKIIEFINTEPKIHLHSGESITDKMQSLVVKNANFRYAETDDYALKNINMEITAGEKIAVVGYNGAGKSTLINLILRLYDPDDGEVLYNKKNIRELNIHDYQNKYGTVFQDYNIYAASIGQNLCMGSEPCDENIAENALNMVNLSEKINSLEDKLATQLTHEFFEKGEILSGGQAQSLAIARMFIRNSEIYILDEPTSALDPLAEAKLFETIGELARDKTVIFISHRFSWSKVADRIYFIDGGEITESGTHGELMEANGKYAAMFNMQAKYYREGHNHEV